MHEALLFARLGRDHALIMHEGVQGLTLATSADQSAGRSRLRVIFAEGHTRIKARPPLHDKGTTAKKMKSLLEFWREFVCRRDEPVRLIFA